MNTFKDFTSELCILFENEPLDQRAFARLCDQWLASDNSPGHFTEDDVIDIISLPIDWKLSQAAQPSLHPLTYFLMNLPFGQPIPVEPRVAQALSDRFGTAKALDYLYHPQALAGFHVDMFDSLHAMCARRAVMAILMPGGVQHLVSCHLDKVNQAGKSLLHLPSSSDRSVMGLLSALVPDEFNLALRHAGFEESAYALFCAQRASMVGDDFYERGMRYVLSRTDSAALLDRFLAVTLGLEHDNQAVAKATESLLSTVLLAALHHAEADSIAPRIRSGLTLAAWRGVIDELINEQASHWSFDVVSKIARLEKRNPLRKTVSGKAMLKPAVIRFVNSGYMPERSIAVIKGLRDLRGQQPGEAEIFISLLAQSLCSGKSINCDVALNLLSVFDPIPVSNEALASLCETRYVLERAIARILATSEGSRQSDSAVSLLARLIELGVYSQAKVYKHIKQPHVYHQFMRDPRHDKKAVLKYCGPLVTRDLLYQAMNL